MNPYLPTFGNVALGSLLLTGFWATVQLPALSQTTKTITIEKAEPAATPEPAKDADDDKERSDERKVIIKSIELADGENAQRENLPWLGVSVNEAGEALIAQLGLDPGVGLVATYVAPDSPAAKAGLQKNDVLVELQDQSLVLPAQLRKLVQTRKEGDVIKLKFYRTGKPQMISATLAKTAPGFRVTDGEEGSSRELHLRLLGHPSEKDLEHQMGSVRGLLGNLKIDQQKVQEEIHRSMDQARKSYRDALRNMDNSTATTSASRQALEELAQSGVLLDNNATVTVRSTGKSARSLVKTDDSGTIVIVANPKVHLTAHDKDGKLRFDGEIETDEQRAKVPKELWEKVEPMVSKLNSKPEE